ncbi:MAG TPA: lytic transglycosylase domain-containing protein [Solirubrobacteraceae bacterium]|jgi:hypothetical protein|nr:lytic transglycosylase domain-containing protein [Solirubrobacteraceae bacterium]
MRVRNRTVNAAGVMSVALVAAARAARDADPRRRVTCVRVPQARPPESPAPATATATAVADGVAAARALEDPALWEPTEVMRAVVVADPPVVVAPAPMPIFEPALEPAFEPEPEPEPESEPALEPAFEPEPEPTPEPTAESLPDDEPAPATAPAPAPESHPAPTAPAAASAPAPADRWGWAEPWGFEVPDVSVPRPRPNAARRDPHRGAAPRQRRPLAALALIMLAAAVSVWAMVPHSPSASAHPANTAAVSILPHPSAFARRTIPAPYLRDYWRAAGIYGLDWTKLAAVGQIESDQGRSQTPGVVQGTNRAGAAGPAQFLGSTWARYGVDVSGQGSSNPYDPADAITAMAAYLKASGAPEDWRSALFAYNHSTDYVDAVLALSRRYLGS